MLSAVEVAAAYVNSAACLVQACQAGGSEADRQPEPGVGRAPRPEAILLLFRVLGLAGQQLDGAARWMNLLLCLLTCMLAEVTEECRMQMALSSSDCRCQEEAMQRGMCLVTLQCVPLQGIAAGSLAGGSGGHRLGSSA